MEINTGENGEEWALAPLPNGQLATGGKMVQIWDTKTGLLICASASLCVRLSTLPTCLPTIQKELCNMFTFQH